MDLSNHKLPQPGMFLNRLRERMPELEELKMANNFLDKLPDAIGNFSSLRDLYLYHNALTSLPSSIGRLAALTLLHLANNKLETLPHSIGNLTQLDRLDADRNLLRELPESIGSLKWLRHLNLAENRLCELPKSIGNLHVLEYLNLSRNRLEALPDSIGELEKLEDLNLTQNRLRTLPESFGKLKKLERLELSGNQLEWLPETIGDLQVTCVELADNRLRALPTRLNRLSNITLDVKNNPLHSLPDGLCVVDLDISGCTALTRLPEDLVVLGNLELGGASIEPSSARIYGNLFWHGIRIDRRIAFEPERISYQEILQEENAERRRVLLERMGYEKFIRHAKAKTLDKDHDPGGERRLLRIEIPNDEALVCLSVKCPSTGRGYVLRVPPRTSTCKQAAAWIAGFDDPKVYHPLIET